MSHESSNLSSSPIERFQNSPPGCEGEPSLEVIAAAAKLADDQSQVTQRENSLDYSLDFARENMAYNGRILNRPGPNRDRRSYARSVASARSSRSYRSDRSLGSRISAGSYRSGRSSCSMASRASTFSNKSNISQRVRRPRGLKFANPLAAPSKKARNISKQLTRIFRQRRLGTPCPPPDPVDAEEDKPQNFNEDFMNLRVSLSLKCHHCHEVVQVDKRRMLSLSIRCWQCSEYMGLCRIVSESRYTFVGFKLRCHGCSQWEEAIISTHTVPDRTDFLGDYEFVCSQCLQTLFLTTLCYPTLKYDCTFCERTFQTKFVWERHETTIHEVQTRWVCYLHPLTDVADDTCVFCDEFNQRGVGHFLFEHRFVACAAAERSYGRKDQLIQHLNGYHRCIKIPSAIIEGWKRKSKQHGRSWACGVCHSAFTDWGQRLKHVGEHWDAGLSMDDWVLEDWPVYRKPHSERGGSPVTEAPTSTAFSAVRPVIQTPSKVTVDRKSALSQPIEDLQNVGFVPTPIYSPESTSTLVSDTLAETRARGVVSGLWSKVKSTVRAFGT